MMKTFLLAIASLALLFPVMPSGAETYKFDPDLAYPVETLVIESPSTGKKHVFQVEVASSRGQLIQGLMFRQNMPEDHGMLFRFLEEDERRFWMKNTLIPLDIIYIKASGTIHHIHENAVPLDETGLPSMGPALNVLELNGGTAAKLGIKPGDIVYMSAGAEQSKHLPSP